MKKPVVLFVFLTLMGFILSACSQTTPEPTVVPVSSNPQVLISEGQLVPVKALDHAFPVSGQVSEILVRDGDSVVTGQELARLVTSPEAETVLAKAQQEELAAQQALDKLTDSAALTLAQTQLAYLEAKTNADQAESNYEATASDENKARRDAAAASLTLAEETLARIEDGKGIDPTQLSIAKARVTAAKAAVESAMDSHILVANMSGSVVGSSIQVGQIVLAGIPVLAISDTSSWLVKTDNLTELEVTQVKVGQKVKVILDALPGVTFTGEVTHINSRFEEKRGKVTYTVTVQLDTSDPLMRWGMTAAIYFEQ